MLCTVPFGQVVFDQIALVTSARLKSAPLRLAPVKLAPPSAAPRRFAPGPIRYPLMSFQSGGNEGVPKMLPDRTAKSCALVIDAPLRFAGLQVRTGENGVCQRRTREVDAGEERAAEVGSAE